MSDTSNPISLSSDSGPGDAGSEISSEEESDEGKELKFLNHLLVGELFSRTPGAEEIRLGEFF